MILKAINLPITLIIILLLSIGILVIYSSSPQLAIQQGIFAMVGLIFYFLISQINYHMLQGLVKPSYILIILLLVFVFILGIETRGVIRWIPLGIFNIQPSEFAKPIAILTLATFWFVSLPTWMNLFRSIFILFPVLFLIFKQPDLGTTLTVCAVWFGVLFGSRVSIKKIFFIFLATLVFIPLGWYTLHDYQKSRITSFLSPTSDSLGIGYNLIQSTIAVGSGEIFGRGLGYGTQSRLKFLPEYRTDFIFATISEEFGFLGAVSILILFLILISYSLKIAAGADYFGALISLGVAITIFFQTLVNIGMNIGVLPITGITLPLVSYGGSSLISTLISLGLVASVAKSEIKG